MAGKKDYRLLENKGITRFTIKDSEYPKCLSETPWPPKELYIKGRLDENYPRVAIVGTRRSTNYGKETAYQIAKTLSENGVVVVSGLALGIDTAAHEGALAGPTPTWAVLGSGVEKIYPSTNKTLAKKIIDSGGAVISEYPPEQLAQIYTFPERNRIVAGFSQLVIVIEAPEKSGALITSRLALEAGREVAAVPGDISRSNFLGSNRLLREGAHPILEPNDALYLIGITPKSANSSLDKLDKIGQSIMNCLNEPKNADEIIRDTKLAPELVSRKLIELELDNLISRGQGIWSRKI